MPKGITQKVLPALPDQFRYLAQIAGGQSPGYIYLLVSEEIGLVKIGASNRWDGHTVVADRRVAEVKKQIPFVNLSEEHLILAACLGKNESEIHKHFHEYRARGEWFFYSDDLKVFVDSVADFLGQCDEWSKNADARPTAQPWNHLKYPPCLPSRKFVGLRADFETGTRIV